MGQQEYYVYLHRKATDNEVFYVGKGKKYRATSKQKRNQWWKNIVAKHGYTVEYVEKGLSEQDAFDLEVETIKFYRENGHNLCNLTDGGDGIIGYVMTEEDKEKCRQHILRPEFKEYVAKIRRRPVLCSNGMKFDSCTDAEKWLGNSKPTSSRVSSACRRKVNSSCGYVWRFLDDCDDLKGMIDAGLDAYVEWGFNKPCLNSPKVVYCSNGMKFDSCVAAAKWLVSIGHNKVKSSQISVVCNGKKSKLKGFKFSYENIFV